MTTRVLPPHEWARLAGTELEAVYPHMNPDDTEVQVVEDDDGRLIACWALLRVYHVEGLWIAPEHRGRGRVALRLLEAMRRATAKVGARGVFTGATTDDVRALIQHANGVQLPGDHYMLPI